MAGLSCEAASRDSVALGAGEEERLGPRPERSSEDLRPRPLPFAAAFAAAASSACCFRTFSCWAIWSSRLVKEGVDLGALSRTRFFSASSAAFFSAALRASSAFLRAASSAARRRSS